ncbi:hypothetical protein BBB56_13045 [Candidatus Pantoea deserta]|uniref:Uncharacterized protein n=1 Tax=Candidatus Pantoea deserta TaxID=1869313 RepID=A0A3N4P573_9GAMM|nr:hypothetical protein BBB56_13045 [Pantoea deserta]
MAPSPPRRLKPLLTHRSSLSCRIDKNVSRPFPVTAESVPPAIAESIFTHALKMLARLTPQA